MTAKILRLVAPILLLAGIGLSSVVAAHAQQSATDALQKAHVFDRPPEACRPSTKEAPGFVLDPAWPQPLPHHWVIGDVGGIAVDKHDHIWVYHRPRSVSSHRQRNAGRGGQGRQRQADQRARIPAALRAAQRLLHARAVGARVRQSRQSAAGLGRSGRSGLSGDECREQDGCVWPAREHGIYVDQNDFVYIAGNGQARNFHGQYPWAPNFGNDSQILKFKTDGTFVYQIGTAGAKGPNSNDTNGGVNGTPEPFWPADMVVDPKTNLMYIADGYGNRRVLIVDAATGKYVGHFGAYGQNPVVGENGGGEDAGEGAGSWPADFKAGNMKPKFFRSPVHCAKLANDGLLYVCDRGNNRVQIFKASEVGKPCSNPDGEVGKCGFVGEVHVAPQTVGGTSGTVNFSTDAKQSCMYVADLGNDVIYVINRQNLTELSRFGGGGRQAGEFHWPHMVATRFRGKRLRRRSRRRGGLRNSCATARRAAAAPAIRTWASTWCSDRGIEPPLRTSRGLFSD